MLMQNPGVMILQSHTGNNRLRNSGRARLSASPICESLSHWAVERRGYCSHCRSVRGSTIRVAPVCLPESFAIGSSLEFESEIYESFLHPSNDATRVCVRWL